jgi:hypothetical protein
MLVYILTWNQGSRAYIRLQEEIIRHSNDQTIFAWSGCGISNDGRLLAVSPAEFISDRKLVQCGRPDSFEMTNRGLRIAVPVLDRKKHHEIERVAVLNCRFEDDPSNVLALRLQSYRNWEAYHVAGDSMRDIDRPKGPGRLTVVNARELPYAMRSQIEISRSSVLDQRGPRLWLDLCYDAAITQEQIEGSMFPRNCWKMHTSLDYQDFSGATRMIYNSAIVDAYDDSGTGGGLGVLFKRPPYSGLLFVAFGFDKSRPPYNDFESHVGQLGVWLTHVPPNAKLTDLMKRYFTVDGMNGSSEDGQPVREATLCLLRGWAVMRAGVALRKVLGEEAILCTVRLTQMPAELYSANDAGESATS